MKTFGIKYCYLCKSKKWPEKMFHKRSFFKNLIWFVIPLVLVLFFNQSTNKHYHVLPNGMVIEHAHPYKNSKTPGTPVQSHHHSDFDLLVLAQLSVVSTLFAILLVLSFWGTSGRRLSPVSLPEFFTKEPGFPNHPLRAPPVLASKF